MRCMLTLAACVASSLLAPAASATTPAATPKVLVITMFGEEAKPWLEGEELTRKIAVPGLSTDYPEVACSPAGLCQMTTAMGFANAASSVSAVVFSGLFDLSRTYFLVAGIAGVDPVDGTLGSAHWARFVVDGGLRHQIDPRQIPQGWESGVVALGAAEPGQPAQWQAGTEVFRLNEDLLQRAYQLSRQAELADGDAATAYRQAYAGAGGPAEPVVSICDTLSADTYWHGSLIAGSMETFMETATEGEGNYCTTQMEDNATLTALRRGADAGLLDFGRVAVLRTASNFDREAPGQTAIGSLTATSGGFALATTNAYRVGSKLADRIIADWPAWQAGVPED